MTEIGQDQKDGILVNETIMADDNSDNLDEMNIYNPGNSQVNRQSESV